MQKPDSDLLMRLIRQHFNEDYVHKLTVTRWKDGIDVQYPVYAIEAFAADVVVNADKLFNLPAKETV